MFQITWTILYLIAGQVHAEGFTQTMPTYESKQVCDAERDKIAMREDYFRGLLNGPLDLTVEAHGECKPMGTPA
jgi:hypothetical protein